MDRRTDAVELLDGPLDDPAALAANLRDLRRINDRLGGASLTAPAIEALAAHRAEVSLLDVGTGGADIPVALLALAAGAGRRLTVVAIDSRPEVLSAAVLAWPAVATTDGLELHVGDGRSLPYPDRSFDVAHASMVVHHCSPDDAVLLLREMGRVSRLGVVVNDLDRTWRGFDRGVAHRPPPDPEPLHPERRAALGTPGVPRRRGGGDAARGRADAGRARSGAPGASVTRSPRSTRLIRRPVAVRRTRSAPGMSLTRRRGGCRPEPRSDGRRDRRRRAGRGGPRGSTARRPASMSSSSSARRPGAGAPAASSRRPLRSPRCAAPGLTDATLATVARPIPAMRVETAAGRPSG